MFTILIKKFFSVTVVIRFTKFYNSKAMKETEMVLVTIIIMFMFFQTNDVLIVFYTIREFGWIPKWVCGHDEMSLKTDNSFNDPFGVGMLIFKVR